MDVVTFQGVLTLWEVIDEKGEPFAWGSEDFAKRYASTLNDVNEQGSKYQN